MREIKFRAWDKINKRMIERIEEDGEYVVCFNGGIRCIEYGDTPFNIILPQYLILMQYTGLKDKNGKEIFEGDIVKFGKVRFVGKATYTPVANEDCKSKIYFSAGAFYTEEGLLSDMLAWHDIEVIGNIYENKDLLK